MAADAVSEEFITIVPVGESRLTSAPDPGFVTVLTVGAAPGAAEVLVQRPRGARLGLGLKFEGGSAAAEKVRRLLVQSCAEDSPAAKASTPWGKLIPGDEILAIDNIPVSELTRIDCVRRLKDSDESLKLIVRHFESINVEKEHKNSDMIDSTSNIADIVRSTLPPPVPPRKLGKKNSFKEKQVSLTISEQNINCYSDQKSLENENECTINGKPIATTMSKLSRKSSFDSHILRQTKEGIACLKKGSPEEIRRLVRRLSDGKAKPPEAEIYIDLLSSEWERCLALADAESDDTGSSISTVVDKLGSMTSSVENSIPSTPILQPKTIDIQKVLNSIENIDTNIYKDIATSKYLERKSELRNGNLFLDNCVVNATKIKNQDVKILNNIITNSEDNETTVQKSQKNDRNNNNTALPKVQLNQTEIKDLISNINDKVSDYAINSDKPKPMPRILKTERVTNEKPKSIVIPKVQCITADSLLTPTKKNCIESWLQKSEAELNNNNMEDENSTPELLPRLIDFVPKPQFKDSESETSTIKRPTAAPPPPPPTETREDGSGASLDTIGELDETNDIAENLKTTTANTETNDRKSTFDKSFWEDRTHRSDNEDKSLSNDESPLPTCPRQPPDGDEMPADAVEKVPDLPSRLPPKLPVGWQNSRKRYSYSSRTQDARSEASVKDKIAMFSNDSANSLDRLDKCGTLPVKFTLNTKKSLSSQATNFDVSILDKRLTKSQDNLDETPYTFKRQIERPTIMGALEKESIKSSSNVTNINQSSLYDNKPLFYGSTSTLSSTSELLYNRPVYHTRSISDDNGKKNVHQSNLEYLIEQRKKSMSKLRGLVIPETQGPIPDLPEIKIQVPLSKSFQIKSNQRNVINKVSNSKPAKLDDNKWKANLLPNNLPKYSPAFKRKSLQVYTPYSLSKESTPVCTFNEKIDTLNKVSNTSNGAKLSRSSLDLRGIENKINVQPLFSKPTLLSKPIRLSNKDVLNNSHDFKNVEIKICTTTDVVDSDNDSAMSSTQSSYRSSASSPLHNLDSIESDNSRVSPRITNYSTYTLTKMDNLNKSLLGKNGEDFVKRKVSRSASTDTNVSFSSSAGSAATSGSQASCSSLESSVAEIDKRKLSKTYNIDTINRRNILASAKCRSGRDNKMQSPVLETKLCHELRSRSPSPKPKTTDRLSTLTSSVSAISNKGENRRRNKIFTETDSDSEDEVNVRQRKTDLKNSRVKRNSSINKNKQIDINSETPKIEDAPKDISDKIIKEIKKAGLDDFKTSSGKTDAKFTVNKVKDNILMTDQFHTPRYQPKIKSDELSSTKGTLSNINDKEKSNLENKKIVEELNIPTYTIRLKRGVGTGVGLILAGGTDCEAKDVTIHRVLAESVADKAGLKRGVKVRNINGHTMTGLTHAQSVAVLKEQRSEVIIEVEKEAGVTETHDSNSKPEVPSEKKTKIRDSGLIETVVLEKAGGGTGLGFGLEGGRDSPYGDRPLTIKKLFAGGAAAQSGRVLVGAELLSAGGQSMEGFTRTQAWAALKALPAGSATLVLRNPV